MLPQPILVSDECVEETERISVINLDTFKIYKINPIDKISKNERKIIAGYSSLPSIDFSGLTEEECKRIGRIDYKLEDFEHERKRVYLETGSLTACSILDNN